MFLRDFVLNFLSISYQNIFRQKRFVFGENWETLICRFWWNSEKPNTLSLKCRFERICIYGRKSKLLLKGRAKRILTMRKMPSAGIAPILHRNFYASVRIFSDTCLFSQLYPLLSFHANKNCCSKSILERQDTVCRFTANFAQN